jgi:chemotaxis methyl-accepting protein methylase
MPRNAVGTTLADAVLPVAAMPGRLIAFRDRMQTVRLPEAPQDRDAPDERALHQVFTELRVRTGHDFSNYKRGTVLRRVERRLGVRQVPDMANYAEFIREHPEEAQALLKDLLISVTQFFRDDAAFKALAQQVIPKLFEGKNAKDQVRVWVPGCATGEEAYSLAMLLSEHAAAISEAPTAQIFATDIDEQAVALAREGRYRINDAVDVSPERLQRFFSKEGEFYRVRKDLREMVLFAHHNLMKAVLASRPRVVPQLPDLPQSHCAGTGDGGAALRAQTERLPVCRLVRIGGGFERPVRGREQGRAHLPESRWGHAAWPAGSAVALLPWHATAACARAARGPHARTPDPTGSAPAPAGGVRAAVDRRQRRVRDRARV